MGLAEGAPVGAAVWGAPVGLKVGVAGGGGGVGACVGMSVVGGSHQVGDIGWVGVEGWAPVGDRVALGLWAGLRG